MIPNPALVPRYNLVLPEELFNELKEIATRQHITVAELLRKFIQLGLIAVQIEENPDAALLIREGDRYREIILI